MQDTRVTGAHVRSGGTSRRLAAGLGRCGGRGLLVLSSVLVVLGWSGPAAAQCTTSSLKDEPDGGAAVMLLLVGPPSVPAQPGGTLSATAERQIEALLVQKARRTPAQRKVSAQLLDARRTGWSPSATLVAVDIRADVTPAVLARIRTLGGAVLSSIPQYRTIRARLPLAAIERLATLDAVQWIRPADQAQTHGR